MLDAHSLKPGDRFLSQEVVVEVLGDKEPAKDFFGREGHVKYMCKRPDTGKTGYMSFGPGPVPLPPAPGVTGYICKQCNQPSPIGVGYATNEKATGDIDACPCGHSQKEASA